jgi:selenocysteine-specific elongation factor
MLAGATGIDMVVLIVAADDSVMPQTREHLEILKLLGIRTGVIALTKSDLVDDTTREVVTLEVRELVKDSFLASAPIVATSAHTGQGIPELKDALQQLAQNTIRCESAEHFRLAIDRSFTAQGHGTVVTGSVVSGAVSVGDELEWHRGDGTTERVRVRGLNNHGQPVERIVRGQRAAINLAGVPHEQVVRGQELATPAYLQPSRVITVRLTASAAFRRPVKHRLPLRLHIGTTEAMGAGSLLDCDQVEPGQWAIAQLFLEKPVTAVWGQPFVIRDSSAEHTLGGGQVLQPVAAKVRRRHVETLEQIERLWTDDPEKRVELTGWFAAFHGFDPGDFPRLAGVTPDAVPPILDKLQASGRFLQLTRWIHTERVAELETRLLDTLKNLHEMNPLLTTHDRSKTLSMLEYIGDDALIQAITDRLIRAKKLVGDTRRIARADFKPKLSANQRKLKDKIVESHAAAGFQPPEPKDFAPQAAGNAASLRDIYEVAVAEGLLVRISADVFLHADVEAEMRRRITERLGGGAGATVAEIRDLLGTTRKFAVPICEYLDRVNLTKRDGDVRTLALSAE